MAEQDKSKPMRCVRDWRDFTLDHYRLPTDGRQWRTQAAKRRHLAEYLATFADGDGTSIKVGIERMLDKFEPVDRATIFRWLDDLRELQALAPKSGLVSQHGCAVRALTLDRFVARYEAQMNAEATAAEAAFEAFKESQTHGAGVAKSPEQKSQSQEQKSQSRAEFATQQTFNRLTDQNPNRPNT